MKKLGRKMTAAAMAVTMTCTTVGGYLPSANVFAADAKVGTEAGTRSEEGRTWWKLQGGGNNGGGHAYGDPNRSAPILLLDNDKRMEDSGTLSLAVKPSDNWGTFYTYVDDNNWLYVGYDNSSKWYYQYKLNGQENYPQIPGLPAPVAGEELQMEISLSNETLSVTVNGVTSRVTNQTLIDFAKQNAGKGRFGVKTNGRSTIEFSDVTYNGQDCMADEWKFAAERAGQVAEKSYEKLVPLTGTVTDTDGKPVEGAVVRVGLKSAVTDAEGKYQMTGLGIGTWSMAVTKPGYEAFAEDAVIEDSADNVIDVVLAKKKPIDLTKYDSIQTETMKVYIGKDFPVVARYEMLSDATGETYFRGNETNLNEIEINGEAIVPTVKVAETKADSRTYDMHVEKDAINLDMKVKVSVKGNNLTWEVTELTKNEGCPKIATIALPNLNLLTVDATETGSVFAGAQASTTTTSKADKYITFDDGFVPSEKEGFLYGFLSNGKLSAGLDSNSEVEGDKRIIRNNGADNIGLTSAVWYYECGDKNGQKKAANYDDYQLSELPCAKVAIADDINEDGDIDWNDGAVALRKVMHKAYGSEAIKDLVNYRIIMNFASMAPNPFLATADGIKKVYLATDGLPQALLLKGYGNEGHDSANSEYADIAEREGGVEDFQDLIKIAHDYNAEIGIHVNAQEAYPEAKSFCEEMLDKPFGGGWGWLDQSQTIDKIWDFASQARWKRFVQLYDRINETDYYSRDWDKGEYVENSKGEVRASKEEIQKDAESRPDNMDFIYLDVWYQDAWETRQVAKEINSLGWRFTTEFSGEGEYDSTWQHWSTDAAYGGAGAKGYNSDIIRFLRNDQRDSQVLNYPAYGGTADNPLLGGFRLYGFEGWQGDRDFNNYIFQTFNQNLPTKFLQHYEVIDWESYAKGESPVGNTEKQITLTNGDDRVVVTRNEEQRADDNIERTITLNGKVVLNDVTYMLPWTDNQDGTEKLYHWNLEGGTTTWELPNGWEGLENVVMYELSDQGRINEKTVAVADGAITVDAEAATPYIVVKGAAAKELKNDFGECNYVVDPGFNGYADGEKLSADDWSGDIDSDAVVVEKSATGDQRLAFNSPLENAAVTTTISGLKAGENYVAEVYMENNSDEKATIKVNTGKETVSNYTERSFLTNYVQCDNKNRTKMQRVQIPFTAEGETAELTLARVAGEGSTYMDDIRIVEKTLNNIQEDGSFKQDFESVVQGLYPFVLGPAQGVSDPVTHLSQLHAPYTQAGWNGRWIDDVIDGEWSLKQHGANTGIIYQTLPQNFRFETGKVYKVDFDYQSGPDKAYAMVVGNGNEYTAPSADDFLEAARGETKHSSLIVVGEGQTWIGLYENGGKAGSGSMGQTDFTLDNLTIKEVDAESIVVVSQKNLYKGETANFYGSNLDKITWTTSNDKVAVADAKAGVIKALGAGTATVTATFEDGTVTEFEITVEDVLSSNIPRSEYPDITSSANTEEAGGEGPVSGYATAATDGNVDTFWHTNWSSTGFNVSPENPAILTVDLGKELTIGGFKFLKRNHSNGIVQQYSYRIMDADKNVLAEGQHLKADNGSWVETLLDQIVDARFIEISVEVGSNGFACICEVEPIAVEKVADDATLEDVTMKAGETVILEPTPVGGTMLKGLVWTSSDKDVATVNKNGVVKALAAGTTTITITNAAGLHAECTVTVEAEVADADKEDLAFAIDYAKSAQEDPSYKYLVPAVKAKFEAALTAAEAVMADETADQAAVDAAYDALVDMFRYLTFTGNSEDLATLVVAAEALGDLSIYTEETAEALKAALAAAKDVLANENALQDEIDAAKDALQAAMDNLVLNPVDKSKLQNLVNKAQKYVEKLAEYTPETAEMFKSALDAAQVVLDNTKATQEEVDTAYANLQNAIFNLRLIPNKDKLEDLINKVKEIDLSKYTAKTSAAVKTALAEAEAVFADENATEAEVKAATAKLQKSVDGLKVASAADDKDNAKDNSKDNAKDNNKTAAKTGDQAPVAVWGMIVVLAMACVLVVIRRRRVTK